MWKNIKNSSNDFCLENNQLIGTFVSKSTSFSVDVNDDLLKAINAMPKNPIRKKY